MTDSLKKIFNHSLNQIPQGKLVNSISELGTEAVNNSFQFDSEDQNSLDNEQLLKMQIKQLKRENAFLKGKIQQLRSGKHQAKPQLLKRQSLNCINILKKKPDPKTFTTQCSLNFILKQIQSILKSLAAIHKLQTTNKDWIQSDSNGWQNSQQGKYLKTDKQFREKFNKKLQLIPLQKQQTRYGSMLQLFSQFYMIKHHQQQRIKQHIQKYIEKTIDISKRLIQNANVKAYQKSMRSSCIYSVQQPQDETFSSYNNISVDMSVKKSLIFQHMRYADGKKHQLSYSTIDAQNFNGGQREIA